MSIEHPELKYWKDGDVECWSMTDAAKHEMIIDYATRYNLHTFVETGTFHGSTLFATMPYFDNLYSIELSPTLHDENRRMFRDYPKVHLCQGDSGEVLPRLLEFIDRPILFWLDAHPSGGETVGASSPLEEELTAIFESGLGVVVLIDDMQPFWTHNWRAVAEQTISNYPNWTYEVKFGVMRIVHD
jgi:hypothetical protein